MKETTAVKWSQLYTSKRRTLPTGLMSSQCWDLHVNQSVLPVRANMLNVLSTSSHQLTLTEQTWPDGCWHYCKPTAPPKHAFSFGAIPYSVCKATIAVSIYISKTRRQNTPPFECGRDKVSQNVFRAAGLPVFNLCWCCTSATVRSCAAPVHA